MSNGPAIGIDMGNSLCRLAAYQHGQVEVIANEQGDTAIPAYVAFTNKGLFIGEEAKRHLNEDPKNTVSDVKCLIGRRYGDPVIQENIKIWPFIIADDNGKPKIQITHKNQKKILHTEQILALILGKLKETAEEYLGCLVKDVVMAVPSHYTYSQRQTLYAACCIAGLNVVRFVSDSLAVSISCGSQTDSDNEHNLIFDFGSNSLSISIVKIDNGIFEEIATIGDTFFGGRDFDERLLSFFSYEFHKMRDKDISNDMLATIRLLKECEHAKCILSSYSEARVDIESLFDGTDFHSSITRECFDELCEDLISKVTDMVEKCLRDANLNKEVINNIIAVGGSSQIPKIRESLGSYFDGKEILNSLDFDEAVVRGAATLAGMLLESESDAIQETLVLCATPNSLGIETDRDHKSLTFPFQQNPMTSLVNAASESLTALGNRFAGPIVTKAAATMASGAMSVAGSMVSENERPFGKLMTTFIKRNSPLPAKQVNVCTTFCNNQSGVLINIYEGECVLTKDNNLIGKLELNEIPPALRGVPKIEISFDLDITGTLTISAREKETNRQTALEGNKFEETRNKVLHACDSVLSWSASTPLNQRNDYTQKKREIEALFQPFITEIQQVAGGASEELFNDMSTGALSAHSITMSGSSRRSSANFQALSRRSSTMSLRSLNITPRGSRLSLDDIGYSGPPKVEISYRSMLKNFSLSVGERCNMIRELCLDATSWLDANPLATRVDIMKRHKEIEHVCNFLISKG
ncbi:hypothetical protein SK128_014935 [Halocaridina rubra]|uniref:Uncharacterized protein n=1 Tax=Halocaridina rubra TaxID=373956 RepID=A0AAN8WW34_HALRR